MAEYCGLALGTSELLRLQLVLPELGVPYSSPTVFCYNQSTIALAHNPVLHARTKHMELDLFFLREKVLQKQLHVSYVPGSAQYADIMTEALPPSKFEEFRIKLTVYDSLQKASHPAELVEEY